MTDDERKCFIGNRLKWARLALGKNGPAWALEYGVGETTQSNWIQGVSFPSREFLIELCENEGLTIDYFYRGRVGGVGETLAKKLRAIEAKEAGQPKRAWKRKPKADPESTRS